jgi:hypothetical protein
MFCCSGVVRSGSTRKRSGSVGHRLVGGSIRKRSGDVGQRLSTPLTPSFGAVFRPSSTPMGQYESAQEVSDGFTMAQTLCV